MIVCGSRDGCVPGLVARALSVFDRDVFRLGHVGVGSTRGVDGDALAWALEHERTVTITPAKWSEHGRAAGPMRNEEQFLRLRPSAVLSFPGGRGTADMGRVAMRHECPLWLCDVRGDRGEHFQWRVVR